LKDVKQNLTCIVCPIGCAIEVEKSSSQSNLSVTGNKCPKGETYAIEELTAPKRTVTATCMVREEFTRRHGGTEFIKRLPVKTSSPCPKGLIPDLLKDIYKVKVSLPVKSGDVIIENWNSEGINIIATRTIG